MTMRSQRRQRQQSQHQQHQNSVLTVCVVCFTSQRRSRYADRMYIWEFSIHRGLIMFCLVFRLLPSSHRLPFSWMLVRLYRLPHTEIVAFLRWASVCVRRTNASAIQPYIKTWIEFFFHVLRVAADSHSEYIFNIKMHVLHTNTHA